MTQPVSTTNGNDQQEVLADFTVTTTNDENDGDFSAGDLSLREAIALANEQEGTDNITFASSLSGQTFNLSLGELSIEDSVTIDGLDAANTIIDAQGNSRVFKIDDGNFENNIDVTLNGLTITGGAGGGISNRENLTINNSIITENTSGSGISSSDGGSKDRTRLTINNSVISNNSAPRGGGISAAPSVIININNSVISDNSAGKGGGISSNIATELNLFNSTVQNNFAEFTGGGIENGGVLNIKNSTINNNATDLKPNRESATFFDPNKSSLLVGIKAGGGIANIGFFANATISNSTISGNSAGDWGGGIYNSSNFAKLQVNNSTITGNSAVEGSGIYNREDTSTGIGRPPMMDFGTVNISSSIVADNTTNDDLGGEERSNFFSGGNNLIGNAGGAADFTDGSNGDIVGTIDNPVNAQLGELQNNGGTTETIALLENSPAIDAGSNPNNLETDQRGEGFERTVGNGTDIGAYEVQDSGSGETPNQLVVSTLEDENDGDFSAGDLSLREAIALANKNEGADTITFASNLSGQTFNLSLGELSIEDSLTIDGLGVANTIIDAQDHSRVFKIDDGNSETNIDVTLTGITITNGRVTNEQTVNTGGGIFNRENLTIQESNINNNYAFIGGGIAAIAGTTKIINSSISGNEGDFISGGIYASNVTIDIDNSIIDSNSAGQASGGIDLNSSTANINNSTISNNSAGGSSGGISSGSSITTITNSTINGNSAASAGGISSGQTSSTATGIVTIQNSTITNNSATVNQGGGVSNGIFSTVNLNNSTITNNSAASGGAGVYQQGQITTPDGDIYTGTVNISSTIIAGNVGDRDLGTEGFFNSGGNNLIGNGDGISSSFDPSQGDLVGTADNPINPQLGELQNNGGTTETIALLEGSPAIDAGSNPNNLETDQRGEGFERTVGNGTDIGAYEVQDSNGGETPTELVVSNLEDENDGDFSVGDLSLREAIALANEQEGADTITFDSSLSGGRISFNSSEERELLIDESLSITGLGQDNLTLEGGFVFQAAINTNLAIDGLNIVGGKIDSFGNLIFGNSNISETIALAGSSDNSAIISRQTTTITDSTIKNNSGGGNVGILVESGTATIEGSAITGNDATAQAQAGIIIRPEATVNVSNSTIANNRGRSTAGIENAGGTVNITNSTIANNRGGLSSGGINNFLTDGVVTITSSVLANNTGGANIGDISGDGEFISGGNNLISNGDDATGFINGVNGDIVGTNGDDPENPQNDGLINARLGELQNNGGLTETIALLEDSPAIDTGSNPNNLATDQRGEGFERTVGNGTDIGAYEVQDSNSSETPTELVVSTLEDENDGDYSAGDLSLREAIALATNDDTITFDSNLSGQTINLSLGELKIEDSLNINGLDVTINANDNSRVFNIDDGNSETETKVKLEGITVSGGVDKDINGNFDSQGGGGILNLENLTLSNSTITDNSAGSRGGGILNQGKLLIENSSVVNNGTAGEGGGILNQGNLTVSNSDLSNNTSSTAFGAGISNRGKTTITNSTINDNSIAAAGIAGGIFNSGELNISYSTLSGNHAGFAGAISNDSFIVSGATPVANISYSTITDNDFTAIAGKGFKINNSTITNNRGNLVGGLSIATGTISNSTISNNSGIYVGGISGTDITISSSIVANNTATRDNTNNNETFGLTKANDVSGELISGGNNLIGDGSDAGSDLEVFINGVNGDIVGTADNPIAPQLGDLQDNGGATFTQELLADSPAIDAGSNPNNLATDQRGEGFERTVGNGTDIGAFEVQDSNSSETPTELVVSTLEDENDGDYSAGDLSLREAIALANEQEGADTITFDSSLSGGTITLTQTEPGGRPGVLLNQDLEITDSVNISGLGADNLTIDGDNGGGGIFAIQGDNNEVNIEGLAIANGSRQRLFFNNPTSGGAIRVDSNNNLNLKDSIITGSSANNGGAVFNNGTTTIINSVIANNASSGGTNAHDGVIANNGEMNLTNTKIQNNDGAGVFNSGVLNIDASLISDNSSAYSGGGILNRKTLTISNSTLRNNSSELNGGGIFNQDRVTVTNTTINGNSANGGAGIETRGTFALINSTVHNNSGVVGSGINNQDDGVLSVDNSTITNNFGGGIYNQNSATVTSSIIAGNTSHNITFTLLPSDFTGSIEDDVVGTAAFTSGGNNLIGSKDGFGDPSPGGFTDGVNGDIVGTLQNPLDPQLGDLQDNGGATSTQALLVGSPAIDAGSNPNNLATDQRGEGFNRTVGNGTDIGAYEVQDSNFDPDIIQGTSEDDLLLGTVADDLMEGLEGSDTLVGDTGNDNLSVTGSNNILLGNEGNDTLFGLGGGNDSLVGGEGEDVLFTESGNSTLIGGEGNDSLSSNGGNNIIQGNEGDDILISSAGGNILLGGAQSDRFNLFISDTGNRNIDIIRDFHPDQDLILLSTNSGMGSATYDATTGALFLDDLQVARLEAGLDIHPDDLLVA